MNNITRHLLKFGFVVLLLALLLVGIVFAPYETRSSNANNLLQTSKPSFPIEIFYEKETELSLTAILVISPRDFTRDNLINLFRWYSSTKLRFSIMKVRVYTNRSDADPIDFDRALPRDLCSYDASFLRYSSSNSKILETASEWFEYRRFLSIPVCSSKVIIR